MEITCENPSLEWKQPTPDSFPPTAVDRVVTPITAIASIAPSDLETALTNSEISSDELLPGPNESTEVL